MAIAYYTEPLCKFAIASFLAMTLKETMILEVAILNVIPGREDEFLEAFSKAQEIISSMTG